jgi:dethiobiotin synthetase
LNLQLGERPHIVVAIVGVGTEVGKTWVTVQIVTELRQRNLTIAARKPVQSFAPGDLGGTDAELLAAASGQTADQVCPAHRWYTQPMAPPMAAESLGRDSICARDLIDELGWSANTDIGLVETVGGVRSPMAHDADSAGFAQLLEPNRTILVADAGLGTINAVRLSIQALGGMPPLVYLNRYDGSDLHQRNRQWLDERDGCSTAIDIATACEWIVDGPDRGN